MRAAQPRPVASRQAWRRAWSRERSVGAARIHSTRKRAPPACVRRIGPRRAAVSTHAARGSWNLHDRTAHRAADPELTELIISPAPQGMIDPGRTHMLVAEAHVLPVGICADLLRRCSVAVLAIAELTRTIISPAPQRAIGLDPAGGAAAEC